MPNVWCFKGVDPELKFIRSACGESRRNSVLAAFVKLRIPLFFCKDCVENPQHCGRLALKVEGGFLEDMTHGLLDLSQLFGFNQ